MALKQLSPVYEASMKKLLRFIKRYEFPLHFIGGGDFLCSKISTQVGTVRAKLLLWVLGCRAGKKFQVDGRLWIRVQRKGAISIGDHVKINSRFGSNLIGLTNPAVFQCLENGTITIGNNSGLSSAILSTRSSITIGENVKIGGNVRIFDHDYHSLDFEERRGKEGDGNVKTRPVLIGDDVFIGTNSMILKGVMIGDRAIIGAGSVVTSGVPADEIWAGNPARFIKKPETKQSA
jgi:acetyltransferase-like isoleucine patch superfamily enzyme